MSNPYYKAPDKRSKGPKIDRDVPVRIVVVPVDESPHKPWWTRSLEAVGYVLGRPWMQGLLGLLALVVAIVTAM